MTNLELVIQQIATEIRVERDGRAFASLRGVGRLLNKDHSSLSKAFLSAGGENPSALSRYLMKCGVEVSSIVQWGNFGIPLDAVEHIAAYYSFHSERYYSVKAHEAWCNLKEVEFLEKQPRKNTNPEKRYQNLLAEKLNGKVEVPTIAGVIDILTSTQLIEVKKVCGWKDALGQVLAYGSFYPSHEKRIHLFGETQASYLEMIRKICKPYNIVVTWER